MKIKKDVETKINALVVRDLELNERPLKLEGRHFGITELCQELNREKKNGYERSQGTFIITPGFD